MKKQPEITEAHAARAFHLVNRHEQQYGKVASFLIMVDTIAGLIAEMEEEANELAKWNPPSVAPLPTGKGVLCDAYLAVTIDSARPCVLTYIHKSAQWTMGEGDTQRIVKWRYITPPIGKRDCSIAPTEQEQWFMDQISLRNMEVAKERARLDWLTKNASVDLEEYRGGSRAEGGTAWYCWRFSSPLNDKHEARAAIDAAIEG